MIKKKMEIWKDIPGYEGLYKASTEGAIKRTNGKVLKVTYCGAMGYGQVALSKNGKPKTKRVHVLICLTFIGQRPKGYHILHINGDPTDNRACNLRYGTAQENTKQAYKDSGLGAVRNQNLITYNGVTKNITEWSKELGGSHHLISDRLNNGWSLEDAITRPIFYNKHTLPLGFPDFPDWFDMEKFNIRIRENNISIYGAILKPKPKCKTITYKGETLSYSQWSKKLGIPLGTIKDRIRKNKSPEEILNTKYSKIS